MARFVSPSMALLGGLAYGSTLAHPFHVESRNLAKFLLQIFLLTDQVLPVGMSAVQSAIVKCLYLKCNGRLRNEKFLNGGFAKAQVLRHRAESLQSEIFELCHATIIHGKDHSGRRLSGSTVFESEEGLGAT